MSQRVLWRGAISFGLIYVPVDLFSAAQQRPLPLHFLDSRDFEPVGYERINKRTGKNVEWRHIVKGYEYQKGKYVALSDADFKHANAKASETIEIAIFTKAQDIAPIFYETPYLLRPGKGGDRVYTLLADTLRTTNKVAVATFVMRGRQHLCVVSAQMRALVLITLRFADDLALAEVLKVPSSTPKLKEAERSMARKLVDEMTAKWVPKDFHDTYREDLMRRIKEKIRKNQVHQLHFQKDIVARPKAEVINLMDALKNSLKLRGRQAPRAKGRKLA